MNFALYCYVPPPKCETFSSSCAEILLRSAFKTEHELKNQEIKERISKEARERRKRPVGCQTVALKEENRKLDGVRLENNQKNNLVVKLWPYPQNHVSSLCYCGFPTGEKPQEQFDCLTVAGTDFLKVRSVDQTRITRYGQLSKLWRPRKGKLGERELSNCGITIFRMERRWVVCNCLTVTVKTANTGQLSNCGGPFRGQGFSAQEFQGKVP